MSSQPPKFAIERAWRFVLGPGGSRHDLRDELAARGYSLVQEQPRGGNQFLTWCFAGPSANTDPDARDIGIELYYQEDHILGQRLVWTRVEASDLLDELSDLTEWLQRSYGARSLAEVVPQAANAERAQDRVATLGAWAALVAGQGELDEAQRLLLRDRFGDANPAVRQAALIAASYLDTPDVAALLSERRDDPVLTVEIGRQLALRSQVLPATGDPARGQLEDEIAASPLHPQLYLRHAQLLATMGQPTFALLEAQIGLALARRDGWPLHEPQALIESLQPQLTTPSGNFLPFLAARLALLLANEQPHVVVEVSELLLPHFASHPVRLPLRLAASLAHRALHRPALTLEALDEVLDALRAGPAPGSSSLTASSLATLLFLRAQLQLAEELATNAVASAEEALHSLGSAPSPAPASPSDTSLPSAIAELLTCEPTPSRRTLHFFCLQTLAAGGQHAAALDHADRLVSIDRRAADAHLARAQLLNQLGRPAAALQACEHALAVLRPIDRLLEDDDPLALLMLQQALAHVALDQPEAAIGALQIALRCDPRTQQSIEAEPALFSLMAQSASLQQELEAAAIAHADVDARTAARWAAAECLQSVPAGSALWRLLHDFFAAVLAVLDEGPTPQQIAGAMGLLSSVESQLDILRASGETAAHSPAVNAAIAAMADALGL